MTTSTNYTSSNTSFGFASPKLLTSETTCNICKRALYSFEEILVCQLCRGLYHRRCVKPGTISIYQENTNYICDRCNDDSIRTTSNQQSNDAVKTRPIESLKSEYREFKKFPPKSNNVPNENSSAKTKSRPFEETQQQQQQQQQTSTLSHIIYQPNGYNQHVSSQMTGQHTDDSKPNYHYPEQNNCMKSEDEIVTTEMFQATYQYTPLKEYAALQNDPITNDTNAYVYQTIDARDQNAVLVDSNNQLLSSHRDGTPLRSNHDYGTKSYVVLSPYNNEPTVTNSSFENVPAYNRQQHFVSTTNLSVNDTLARRQQQQQQQQQGNQTSSIYYSSPYLSQMQDVDSPNLKRGCSHHYYADRNSNVESDSGIIMVQSTHQPQKKEDNQIIEKKITEMVQKLGQQLETDTQKLSNKLETKLKTLEHMINQQTFIIREQDDVIEHLKSKISKIETERNQLRVQLSVHEQTEHYNRPNSISENNEHEKKRKSFDYDGDPQPAYSFVTNRKSDTSSIHTDHGKRPSKKGPAPRIDNSVRSNASDNESVLAKFIHSGPVNPDRRASDSSNLSAAAILAQHVPLIEPPAAANRLDTIIHQSIKSDTTEPTSDYYNVGGDPYDESKQYTEQNMSEQYDPTTIPRLVDGNSDRIKTTPLKTNRSSSSSDSSFIVTPTQPTIDYKQPTDTGRLPPRSPDTHRSLDTLARKTNETEDRLKPTQKAVSLDFDTKPVRYTEPESIYFTPKEAPHQASQYKNVSKGWLRKRNPDSILKRMENFYFVLINNALLMHKHEQDRRPYKAIHLKGARLRTVEDAKHTAYLEVTWTLGPGRTKRYQLFARNKQELQQWNDAIRTAIDDLPESKRQ